MSTFDRSYGSNNDKERYQPASPLIPQVEAAAAIQARVTQALHQARTWWTSRHHIHTDAPLPDQPELARYALTREAQALKERIAKRRQEIAAANMLAHNLSIQLAHLEAQAAQERQRRAAEEATALAQAETTRRAAKQALVEAERVAVAASRWAEADTQAVHVAEQASKPGRARTSRVERKAAKDATPAQAEATRAEARRRTALIIAEATRPVAWRNESEVAGIREPPVGMFACAVSQPAPFSRVVGATGRLAAVDWSAQEATAQAVSILHAQLIPAQTKGGHYHHVAHGVLSKPHDGSRAVQPWSDESAMRAARHYLCALGVEPDRHDVVVFAHAQQLIRPNGKLKVEEAVHVLWSRVRDDGAVHACGHAFVAAAVGRARYDVAAGIDPERIAMTLSRKGPILDGLRALKEGALTARFVDPETRRVSDVVHLQSSVQLQRLAHEGHSEAGDFAGTWTPKPGYRHALEIQRIMDHLRQGD
jgi:hypothetical protein